MTPAKLLVVAAVGLSATACSYSSTTQATAPVPAAGVVVPSSQTACIDYGFQPGSASYNRCVARESEARGRGRMPATYATGSLTADAQAACSSYGLAMGSMTYDRCVSREIDARRYRQEATVTTYTTPGPVAATTVYSAPPGTTVYSPAATTTVVPAATTPPTGVQAFRDEYGFRYDGQGNRIDARGNIVSPQSTQP